MRLLLFIVTTVLQAVLASGAQAQVPTPQPHNVVLFIADGLRFAVVDERTAPTTQKRIDNALGERLVAIGQ